MTRSNQSESYSSYSFWPFACATSSVWCSQDDLARVIARPSMRRNRVTEHPAEVLVDRVGDQHVPVGEVEDAGPWCGGLGATRPVRRQQHMNQLRREILLPVPVGERSGPAAGRVRFGQDSLQGDVLVVAQQLPALPGVDVARLYGTAKRRCEPAVLNSISR